mmetsp:Transcript_8556/g.35666  ORF Transcript_8556/g.35666 Transcript_8556/m.35666 type:complete len:315 (+) Transcript_8556:440-1384(+)
MRPSETVVPEHECGTAGNPVLLLLFVRVVDEKIEDQRVADIPQILRLLSIHAHWLCEHALYIVRRRCRSQPIHPSRQRQVNVVLGHEQHRNVKDGPQQLRAAPKVELRVVHHAARQLPRDCRRLPLHAQDPVKVVCNQLWPTLVVSSLRTPCRPMDVPVVRLQLILLGDHALHGLRHSHVTRLEEDLVLQAERVTRSEHPTAANRTVQQDRSPLRVCSLQNRLAFLRVGFRQLDDKPCGRLELEVKANLPYAEEQHTTSKEECCPPHEQRRFVMGMPLPPPCWYRRPGPHTGLFLTRNIVCSTPLRLRTSASPS